MACVIRVKRRIDDDPAETILLSCKKRRDDVLEHTSVLSLAGTIRSKNEPVSSHIREAFRQRKIHKELHPHSASFKHSLDLSEVTSKRRKETEQTSRTNRYRITWSHRALDLDLLDKEWDQDDTNPGISSGASPENSIPLNRVVNDKDVKVICTENKQSSSENKENNIISPVSSQRDSACSEDISSDKSRHQGSFTSKAVSETKTPVKEDKMFCIFDVENETEDSPQKPSDQQSASGITLNNVPMQSKRVTTPSSNEFVYDLYYTNNNLSDLDQKAVLTVEALCDELVYEQTDENLDRDMVYDDEDDSNDENNWRADYPDEDPLYFENAEEDYDYAEDMVDTNFLYDDDKVDLLTYWMDTRCKVENDSDDGEDEYEEDDGDCSESSDE